MYDEDFIATLETSILHRRYVTPLAVGSRAGAVPLGAAYLGLPVSSGSASLASSWVRLQPPPRRT